MRREAGFTLLELLIAITLLGLLMAALFGGLKLGVRAWEVGGERLEENARIKMVQHLLRDRLTQIYPVSRQGEREATLAFRGEPDRLSFITLLSERLGFGLGMMSLHAGEGPSFELRWRPFAFAREEAETGEAPETRVLLEGIEAIECFYFGAPEPGAPIAWRDEWESTTVLPKLIRLRVVFPPGDARVWPDLIVRPMIDMVAQVF